MATGTDNHLPQWRAPMDGEDLRRYQTRAVKAAERILYDSYEEGDRDAALKAVTRLTQAVQCYLRVLEAHELEERVAALEEAQERREATNGTAFTRN